MPSFTIYQIGHPDRHLTVTKPEITIGREEESDLLLAETIVSRRHARVRQQGKDWVIEPLAERNPTVVNGEVVPGPTLLQTGDELQIGCFLLIFSAQALAGPESRQVVSYHARCAACKKWEGTVAVLKSQPVCPECGSARLVREKIVTEAPKTGPAKLGPLPKRAVLESETKYLTPDDVLAYQERVKRASQAYLVRLPEAKTRVKLFSDRPNIIGKSGKDASITLEGFLCGFGRAEVTWKGTAYVLQSFLPLATVKVNGSSTKESRLKSGDRIEIGANSFLFEIAEE